MEVKVLNDSFSESKHQIHSPKFTYISREGLYQSC